MNVYKTLITPVESAFRYLIPCPCRQGPALCNYDGNVRFMCECGKSGPAVRQGPGAAMRACQQWNRMREEM